MKFKEKGPAIIKRLAERWFCVALIVDVLLCFCMIFLYWQDTKELIHYSFDESDFVSYQRVVEEGNDNRCFGGTIDESYESGLYNAIPSFHLKKGYYEYKVSWEGSSSDSFVWPHTYLADRYNTVEQSVIYLAEGVNTYQEGFWINVDYDLALCINYSGQGSVTFQSFEIRETNALATRTLFLRVVGFLLLNLAVFIYAYQRKKTIPDNVRIAVFGILVISLISSIPVLFPRTIEGHDLMFHLCRIEGIRDGWLSGQFPVRINPVFYNGYGYACPVFYGDLLLYFPAFLQLVGFRLTTAYNLYVIFVNVLTALLAYYSFSRILKDQWITLATVFLYCMAPYRLVDIYLRSAVGEYNAMAFLPLVVYGMYRIYTEDAKAKEYKYCFLPLVFGITGILQNHILSVEMIAVFLFMACVFLLPLTLRRERFLALLKTVLVSVLLNMSFLVPFFDYFRTGRFYVFQAKKTMYLQKMGMLLGQFFDFFPKWGWTPEDADQSIRSEMPTNLGMALCLGLLLCVGLLLLNRRKEEKIERKPVIVLLLLCFISLWMASAYFPWDVLIERSGGFAYLICSIQFVWRFLAIATVLAALLSGLGFAMLSERAGRGTAFCVSCAVCTLSLISGVFFMEEVLDNGKILRMNDSRGIYTMGAVSGGEYAFVGSKWATEETVHEPELSGGVQITDYRKLGTTASFTVTEAVEDGSVLLPMIAFPGYRVTSKDGILTQSSLSEGDSARVQITIPKGFSGEVKVFYREAWYWRIAEVISLLTLIGIIAFWNKGRKERYQN